MASKAAVKRLTKEYATMQKESPPFVWAAPDEKNILHWNYIIRGPPGSPYAGGEFYGVILFPADYPFKPPGIKMITPSGRFQPDKKICFSMSDFHPGSWNPAWSVATILTGLLSFMLSDEITTGGVTTSDSDKRRYSMRSHAWNIENRKFREAFPEYSEPIMKDLPNMAQKDLGVPEKPAPVLSTESSAGSTSSRKSSPVSPSSPISNADSNTAGSPVRAQIKANIAPPAKVAEVPADGRDDSSSLGQSIWGKWYWGIFIALALAVSSRLTGSS